MAYLLDANVLIEAKNRYYGFDFCPAFWDWIVAKNAEGQIFTVKEVGNELEAGGDYLVDWIRTVGDSLFVKPTDDLHFALKQVNDWAKTQTYDRLAVKKFLTTADCHLVAHALSGNHEVVTLEIPSDSKKRIKIPNACIAFGVKCVTPFEMLRCERARFVLGTAA